MLRNRKEAQGPIWCVSLSFGSMAGGAGAYVAPHIDSNIWPIVEPTKKQGSFGYTRVTREVVIMRRLNESEAQVAMIRNV